MGDSIATDIRYALEDIDLEFTISQCQDADYRILYNHTMVEYLLLFSSSFVVHNNGYYPFQLIQLMSSNVKQEVLLKSIAIDKPCCHIQSCIRLYNNSIASHIFHFFVQLNENMLPKSLPLPLPFDMPVDVDHFPYLHAIVHLIKTEFDIALLYDLPIILQSYVFTWHFTIMFYNKTHFQLLLNNKLYLDKPCRSHIFNLLKSNPFDNKIHLLCRGYNDNERDDEDEFIFNHLLQLYTYDQLIIAYNFLLADYNQKLKRVSYIHAFELHLLRHIKLESHFKLLSTLMHRKPLECCSLCLVILDFPSISSDCIDSIFQMLYDLWDALTPIIKRDLFTQFILPLLYKSYNAPIITLHCLEITSRMTHVESFQALITQIALALMPPLPLDLKLPEVVNSIYYNPLVGNKALKCLSKLPLEMASLFKNDAKLIFKYFKNLCFSDDLYHFLSYFVTIELHQLQRHDYMQQQHRIFKTKTNLNKLKLPLEWDGYFESFLLCMQVPPLDFDFDFNFNDLVKFSHALLAFSQYCYRASPDQINIILRCLTNISTNIKSHSTTIKIAVVGVLFSISCNPHLSILLNHTFLHLLLVLVPVLPNIAGYKYYKVYYNGVKHVSPYIMHLVGKVIDLLDNKPDELELEALPLDMMNKEEWTVKEQRNLLWWIGHKRQNEQMDELLNKCIATSLTSLKQVVFYLMHQNEPILEYKTANYYVPPPGTMLDFVIKDQLLQTLMTTEIIPNMTFTRNITATLLQTQAPFNQELGFYLISHFMEYLDYDLLLDLFGMMSTEFNNKIQQRGKKMQFKPLHGMDIKMLPEGVDWIKLVNCSKTHVHIRDIETMKIVGQFIFDKLEKYSVGAIVDLDKNGIKIFEYCTSSGILGEYLLLATGDTTDLQLKASELVRKRVDLKIMQGLVKLMKRNELVDLVLYHDLEFEYMVHVVAEYVKENGLNKYGLAQRGLCELEPQRLLCIMKRYPECIELLNTAYFQPNETVEDVFVDLLLD